MSMKKMIIKGVGTFMAKKYNEDGTGVEVITLGTLQDLRIDLNVDIEDIFGGDGMFPIDTLVRNKSIEITATDAKFDLDAVALMMGSTITNEATGDDAYVWVMGEEKIAVTGANGEIVEGEGENQTTTPVAVATITPDYSDSIFTSDPAFAVRVKGTNKLLKQATFQANTAPDANTFMYDPTNKKIILPATLVGADIVFNYKRAETVDMAALLKDEIPFPVHVVHHGSFLQADGTFQGVETELYCCRAMGTFSINAARATASTSQVQLRVLDPERADKRLGTIKRYSANSNV
jgi:hypothetical protein